MEKLTKLDGCGHYDLKVCFGCHPGSDNDQCGLCSHPDEAYQELGKFEASDLTPGEVIDHETMFKAYWHVCGGRTPEEIAELMKTKQEERKSGDTVWCIEKYDDSMEVSGFIFVAQNEECVIVASDPVGYKGTISQNLIEESAGDMGTEVYAFPVEDVFDEQETAEAAKKGQE